MKFESITVFFFSKLSYEVYCTNPCLCILEQIFNSELMTMLSASNLIALFQIIYSYPMIHIERGQFSNIKPGRCLESNRVGQLVDINRLFGSPWILEGFQSIPIGHSFLKINEFAFCHLGFFSGQVVNCVHYLLIYSLISSLIYLL